VLIDNGKAGNKGRRPEVLLNLWGSRIAGDSRPERQSSEEGLRAAGRSAGGTMWARDSKTRHLHFDHAGGNTDGSRQPAWSGSHVPETAQINVVQQGRIRVRDPSKRKNPRQLLSRAICSVMGGGRACSTSSPRARKIRGPHRGPFRRAGPTRPASSEVCSCELGRAKLGVFRRRTSVPTTAHLPLAWDYGATTLSRWVTLERGKRPHSRGPGDRSQGS